VTLEVDITFWYFVAGILVGVTADQFFEYGKRRDWWRRE